jgi:two-component system nitrogen regulation sensor histidine kinase GlnL
MKASNSVKRRAPTQISWEQILANLDDGVVVLDAAGKVIFFNEASEVLTDISSAAATEQPLEQIFKREPWLVDLVKRTHPPRQKRARGEGDFISRWGRKTPVSITVSPLQDRHGQFVGTILLLRDIKRRKELEEDLKRADRLVLMGTFGAGLAHEVRNPLGGIKGAAQLLRRSAEGNDSTGSISSSSSSSTCHARRSSTSPPSTFTKYWKTC